MPIRLVGKTSVGETPTGATETVALPRNAEYVSQPEGHGKHFASVSSDRIVWDGPRSLRESAEARAPELGHGAHKQARKQSDPSNDEH